MKILYISRAYSQSSGGMERLSFNMIQTASAHRNIQAKSIVHQGSRLTSPLFCLTVIPKALYLAREHDTIHIGDPMLSLAGWLIRKILRKKTIVTVHGLDILYPNFFYRLYLRLFFRSFDLYLPISQAVADKLRTLSVKGKTVVINPGISNDYYDPSLTRLDLKELLARAGIKPTPPNCTHLLTTGRLVKRKGHAWFIGNVLPQISADTHYVIAGDGPEMENIKEAINIHQLSDRVHLLGRVTEPDLKILYNTADAFIQPNIPVENDLEGFGLVLLEAALCNTAIFASNIEGISDAISSGDNGALLPAQESQAWVTAMKHLTSKPRANIQTRSYTLNKFSWDSYMNKFLQATGKLF